MNHTKPPANTPRAPRAMREECHGADRTETNQAQRINATIQDFDIRPGHSVCWVSDEAAARKRFVDLQDRARHLGMQGSPFLPKNAAELNEVLAQRMDQDINKLRRKIKNKEDAAAAAAPAARDQLTLQQRVRISTPSNKSRRLLNSKKGTGEASTILMLNNWFNESITTDDDDWPSIAEFRAHKLHRETAASHDQQNRVMARSLRKNIEEEREVQLEMDLVGCGLYAVARLIEEINAYED